MPYVIKAVNPRNEKDVLVGQAYPTMRQAQHAIIRHALETLMIQAIFGSPVIDSHPLKTISRVKGEHALVITSQMKG